MRADLSSEKETLNEWLLVLLVYFPFFHSSGSPFSTTQKKSYLVQAFLSKEGAYLRLLKRKIVRVYSPTMGGVQSA